MRNTFRSPASALAAIAAALALSSTPVTAQDTAGPLDGPIGGNRGVVSAGRRPDAWRSRSQRAQLKAGER